MTEEYEILEAESDKNMNESNDPIDAIVDMATDLCESFSERLKKYGLSMSTDISDEDGDRLAMAMFHGGQELDECLEYLANKYGSEKIGEGVTHARLEQPRI